MRRTPRIEMMTLLARGCLLMASALVVSCELGPEWYRFHREYPGSTDAGSGNHPPELTLVFVAPLQAGIGDRIELSAEAADPDGDALAFRWTATNGAIARPRAANTSYTCKARGSHTLTVTVSDGGGHEDRLDVPVKCR